MTMSPTQAGPMTSSFSLKASALTITRLSQKTMIQESVAEYGLAVQLIVVADREAAVHLLGSWVS
ncbi:MAG: hypothetical protein OXD01_05680 [Gammaproteobacteria bacterium]|nr:hypothetical protein [Gammaproteobacteria bacterium]